MIGRFLKSLRAAPTREQEERAEHHALIREAVRKAHREAFRPPRRRSRWSVTGARETAATIDVMNLIGGEDA